MVIAKGEQTSQRGGSGTMHRATNGHLHGLQIQPAGFTRSGEDHLQQPRYFLLDFLLDGFRRFFSSGDRVSAAGRARQIFSLTSSSC